MKTFAAVLLGATAFLSVGAAYAADLVVGVSWNNFQEERWKTDEAAIKAVLDAAGVKYISTDAQSSATKQLTDVEQLISQGAKALVCRVKITSNTRKHVLAVFPADRQADLDAVAAAVGGKKASLVPHDLARELTGCEIGAIPPFTFNPELQLVVDPTLRTRHDEIAFNAGRLDASIVMRTADYFRVAAPEQAVIVKD